MFDDSITGQSVVAFLGRLFVTSVSYSTKTPVEMFQPPERMDLFSPKSK